MTYALILIARDTSSDSREGSRLLAFLRHDIEYHNNTSERALRLFAVMRNTLYGSRSER